MSEPVLRLGAALAVLVPVAGADKMQRFALAGEALRRFSGYTDIRLVARPSGRPALAPPWPELGVSLSRRGALMLTGFSPRGPVGVDFEVDGPDSPPDATAFAADHFTAREAEAVALAQPALARELVHRLWSAKEAVLKRDGRGVFDGLAEPDLTAQIEALMAGAPLTLTGRRFGGVQVQVTRHDGAFLALSA